MPQSGFTLLQSWFLFCCLTLAVDSLSAQGRTAAPPTLSLTLTVEGVDGPLRDNVLAFLELNRFAGKPAPDEVRLRWLHNNAEREIHSAGAVRLFRTHHRGVLTRTPEGWVARYRIEPGRPLRIAEIDVRYWARARRTPPSKLLDSLPLAQGQTLDQPKPEQIKAAMGCWRPSMAISMPFTERSIRVDLQAYSATIHLHYDTGQRFRFGNIALKQDFLSPELLAPTPPGR